MIPDVFTWAYDLAVSWLPPLPSLLWGETDDENSTSTEETATAPGTSEALARAKEALRKIEADDTKSARSSARPLDARFRSSSSSILGGGGGIHRLVGRLEEVDVGQLASPDREALMGAAPDLMTRLRQR